MHQRSEISSLFLWYQSFAYSCLLRTSWQQFRSTRPTNLDSRYLDTWTLDPRIYVSVESNNKVWDLKTPPVSSNAFSQLVAWAKNISKPYLEERGGDWSIAKKRIKRRNFASSQSVQTQDPAPLAVFAPSFFLFSFAKCAAINSDWRTRAGSRFKEGHNVRILHS